MSKMSDNFKYVAREFHEDVVALKDKEIAAITKERDFLRSALDLIKRKGINKTVKKMAANVLAEEEEIDYSKRSGAV